jgi:orotate phosphoribosyltransferase
MDINKRLSQILVETKAFRDLENPVILTSGELGIYYINTEKLVQDNGEFEKYGDNSREMIKHAVRMMHEHPTFKEAIHLMLNDIVPYVNQANRNSEKECFFSGGQRRDWLFSGPMAEVLGMWHASLYKNGKYEFLTSHQDIFGDGQSNIKNLIAIHVVDLLTEGSSVYRQEDLIEKGWLPELRKRGAIMNDLFAVVSRKQGAEEMLKKQGVNAHSFVDIDENFLKNYSKNPEMAIEYSKNPKQWSENYLKENGALIFLDYFNPEGKNIDRARKFLKRYGNVLQQTAGFYELDKAVQQKYSKSLDDLATTL